MATHIDQALAGPRRGLRLEGERPDLKGRKLPALAFYRDGKLWLRVWMDPAHGCLPLQIDQFGAKDPDVPFQHTIVDDVLALPGGRWLPQRVLLVFPSDPRTKEPVMGREIKVLEFHGDRQPDPSLFQIKLPPRGNITDTISGNDRVVNRPGEIVSPQGFEYLLSRRASPSPRVEATALGPGPAARRRHE